MGMIAFVFPGQGSQRVGMGADLQKHAPDLFDGYVGLAETVSGLSIRQYCLEGPIEALTRTEVAQPALFAVSLALADCARRAGLRPDFVAGHSLGEYTAAVAAKALSLEDGMALVCERGRLMAEVQSEIPGAMAAIVGLPVETLRELCARASNSGHVDVANLNTPTQIVVSGSDAGVEHVLKLAAAAGAEKAIRLQVGAAFHSTFMKPLQARLAVTMERLAWQEPEVAMASNAFAELVRTAQRVRDALLTQIASPVRWVECVRALIGAGTGTFLELGAGRVLSGLTRQIDADVETSSADTPDKVMKFANRRLAGAQG
jgi:[acyl-carrier-protein] S-malonyltransferase